jgi:hypothetical protein
LKGLRIVLLEYNYGGTYELIGLTHMSARFSVKIISIIQYQIIYNAENSCV